MNGLLCLPTQDVQFIKKSTRSLCIDAAFQKGVGGY